MRNETSPVSKYKGKKLFDYLKNLHYRLKTRMSPRIYIQIEPIPGTNYVKGVLHGARCLYWSDFNFGVAQHILPRQEWAPQAITEKVIIDRLHSHGFEIEVTNDQPECVRAFERSQNGIDKYFRDNMIYLMTEPEWNFRIIQ